MVKNYLVCAIRPVRDGWMGQNSQDLHQAYQKLYQISVASFRRFVYEPFETILWTDPVENNFECNKANWNAIKELWHREPCNIFWAGADTFMMRPTALFGSAFREYRLFNYTDPRSHKDFPHYFNDDIQYFPHTMSESVWRLGEDMLAEADAHPEKQWGFDQLRHNAMFWSQDIPMTLRTHPTMAYQAQHLRTLDPATIAWHNEWNGVDINNANILHFHASRGTEAVYAIMQDLASKLRIEL